MDSDEEWEQDVDGESVDRSDGSEEEEEEEGGEEGEPNKDALDYEDGWLCEDNYVECVGAALRCTALLCPVLSPSPTPLPPHAHTYPADGRLHIGLLTRP